MTDQVINDNLLFMRRFAGSAHNKTPRIVFAVTDGFSLSLLGTTPRALANEGWDVYVVSSMTHAVAPEDLSGVHYRHLDMQRGFSIFADFKALLKWIFLLAKISPDVTSFGTPKASLLCAIASALTGVPTRVYMLRGLRLETSRLPVRLVLRFAERLTSKLSSVVVAVSHSLRQEYIRRGLTEEEKIVILGHGSSKGVDIESITGVRLSDCEKQELRASLEIPPDVLIVGFVGRITPDKGVDTLFEASNVLTARGVQHWVLLVGPLESGKGRGVDVSSVKNVSRLELDFNEIGRAYSLIDVLCHPSLREGFPNVILEASLALIPTVTTDATGAIEAVLPGITGFVEPKGSSQLIANSLQKLLEDEVLRVSMGNSAREWVSARYDTKIVVRMQVDFYFSLLFGKSGRIQQS